MNSGSALVLFSKLLLLPSNLSIMLSPCFDEGDVLGREILEDGFLVKTTLLDGNDVTSIGRCVVLWLEKSNRSILVLTSSSAPNMNINATAIAIETARSFHNEQTKEEEKEESW